jgi:molybdenum cofactor biosynthesis enzyme MoaA
MNDALGRPLKNLRLSVTDRCNLLRIPPPEDDYAGCRAGRPALRKSAHWSTCSYRSAGTKCV